MVDYNWSRREVVKPDLQDFLLLSEVVNGMKSEKTM